MGQSLEKDKTDWHPKAVELSIPAALKVMPEPISSFHAALPFGHSANSVVKLEDVVLDVVLEGDADTAEETVEVEEKETV